MKKNAHIVNPARIKKARILPMFVFIILKNTELTTKLLNQFVAVDKEFAVPIN